MKNNEEQYINLINNVMSFGIDSDDRTGVGTRSLFAPPTIRFSLRNDSLPVITTRRTFFRGAVEELLWMMKGQTDANVLKDKNIHIWDGNTTEEFIEKRGLKNIVPESDIGTLYGFQMRNWGGDYEKHLLSGERTGVDQLKHVVNVLRKDPTTRRAVMSFYNPDQINTGVLEPCHLLYIFYVNQRTNELYCHLTIRSWDLMCGAPINIIWTSLFTKIIARLCGLEDGGIAITSVNGHIYKNHFGNVTKQVSRTPYPFPMVKMNADIKELEDIDYLQYSDFELINYQHHAPIKYEMAI